MAGEPSNVVEYLARWAEETPEREAIRAGDQSWTWAEFEERARRFAAGVAAEGLRPGDRFCFLDKNSVACLEGTFAAAYSGTANAVVNWRLAPEEIAYVVDDAGARLLFAGYELIPSVEAARHRLPADLRVITVGGPADEYEAWLAGQEPVGGPGHNASPDDCFLQLYTSGTTGFPKGAMLTHRSMVAHTEAVSRVFTFTPESVNLVPMPLFHVGGTSWALAGMAEGARTVLVREVLPTAVLDDIERERVTHAFLVPAVFGFLLQVPGVAERDYSSIAGFAYGGSPMPLPLLQRCLDTFPCDFYQVYGMTEMSGAVTILDPEDHRDAAHPERLLSAGRPMGGVEMKVVDPVTGADLGPGETGEVWMRSAQCMAGYWRRPEATAETIVAGGWLRSGDAGRLDEAGYVFIEDRVKDMIVTGGENVYPAEVERVLLEHPAIADVAVIGIPDEQWGEAVKAVVVPAEGAQVARSDLLAFCRDRLAAFKCPRSVDIVDELPRNPTGKVLRRQLREPYWEGRERRI